MTGRARTGEQRNGEERQQTSHRRDDDALN